MEKLINKDGQIINETKLARIWQHFENENKAMVLMTAFRGGLDRLKENIEKNKMLANEMRKAGFGYTWLEGHFIEDKGTKKENEVVEHTLLITAGEDDADKLLKLATEQGIKYEQESILYKPIKEKNVYSINLKNGEKFDIGKFHGDKIGEMYSRILKGDKRPFIFESAYYPPNWFDMVSVANKILEKVSY